MEKSGGAKRSGAGLANLIAQKSKSNIQRITEAAQSNMELQAILCETIDNYESAKESGDFQLHKKKKARAEDTSQDKKLAELMGRTLNRNQAVFRKWSSDLLRAMIRFADPQRVSLSTLAKITSKDRLLELVEYLFDLKVFHHKPDRASTLDMKELLPRMKELYISCGQRMQGIEDHVSDGFLDWRLIGHYEVKVVEDDKKNSRFSR